MKRTHISDITNHIGKEITLAGFAQAVRDQGGIKFLVLRDVTGIVQLVFLKNKKEVFDRFSEISLESVIKVTGLAKEEKQAPSGFELEVYDFEILSKADPELPIPVVTEKSGDETDVTKRLDWRFIDLRKQKNQEIFKTWTALEKGFRNYFEKEGFIQLYSPSFMSSPSETGSEVFEVKYFERKAYLAQSPQFYKQMAMAAGMEKIFMFGPVFRAEPSFTTRHMTEFTGWDFEVSYVESHHDVMDQVEAAFRAGFVEVGENLPEEKFPRISMSDAKKKLSEAGVKSDKEHDISPEEERELGRLIKEETGSDFVFLIDYHKSIRPFYHMRHEDNPDLTKSFDLVYKGVEVVTGAQREHRVEVLEKQAKEKGMDLESLGYYIDFFRYGCPPHGGAGIGPGRIIMKLLDLPSVKEATFLPRDVKRLNP